MSSIQQNIPCDCPNNDCVPCSREKKCPVKMDSACIVYHMDEDDPVSDLTCLNLPNGSTLEDIIEAIDDKICNGVNIPITPLETFTAKITASGQANHTIKIDVKVSEDSGNDLEIRPDGLYINSIASGAVTSTTDTPTIDLNVSSNVLSANAKISSTVGNILTSDSTGLLVPLQTLQVVTDAGHISNRTDIQLGGLGINGSPTTFLDVRGNPLDGNQGRLAFDGVRLILKDDSQYNNILIGGSNTGGSIHGTQANIGIGVNALKSLTGNYNTAIGSQSMATSGTVNYNVAVGDGSFKLNNGDANSFLGYQAGVSAFGDNNISIGYEANTANIIATSTVNNTELVVANATITGSGIASFISSNSLVIGTKYATYLHFNGTAPTNIGLPPVAYANATPLNSNTLQMEGVSFDDQGSGTFDISLYDKQSNSIAIGAQAFTTASNQIRLGNGQHTMFVMNNFTFDLTVSPTTTVGRIIHDGTNYKYEKYSMFQGARDLLTGADLYEGREIYNLTIHKTQTYDGTNWQSHW